MWDSASSLMMANYWLQGLSLLLVLLSFVFGLCSWVITYRKEQLERIRNEEQEMTIAKTNKIASEANLRAENLNREAEVSKQKQKELEIGIAGLTQQNLKLELKLAAERKSRQPRILDGDQLRQISEVARIFPGQKLLVTRYTLSKEAQNLSDQIELALRAGGWIIETFGHMSGAEQSAGIHLIIDEGEKSGAGAALATLLTKQGFYTTFSSQGGFIPERIPPGELMLFVGPKPTEHPRNESHED